MGTQFTLKSQWLFILIDILKLVNTNNNPFFRIISNHLRQIQNFIIRQTTVLKINTKRKFISLSCIRYRNYRSQSSQVFLYPTNKFFPNSSGRF